MTGFALEDGETLTSSWPVEAVRAPGSRGTPGWLVLTDRRVLFYRRGGLLGGRSAVHPPEWSTPLGELQTVSACQFTIRIGYGDQVLLPGVELDGHRFILNRETPSAPVLAAIGAARTSGGSTAHSAGPRVSGGPAAGPPPIGHS